MESDLTDHPSLLSELFTGLCRKAGLCRRIACAIDLELPRHDSNEEFLCGHSSALTCGDVFTLEAIYRLIATASIPYWQLAARQINEFNRGQGFDKICKRAAAALDKWKEFDKAGQDDSHWHDAWRKANCGHDRRELIRGDNWRAPVENRPREHPMENSGNNSRQDRQKTSGKPPLTLNGSRSVSTRNPCQCAGKCRFGPARPPATEPHSKAAEPAVLRP